MKRLIVTMWCVLCVSSITLAVPTEVNYLDGPQDPLIVPPMVHELGNGPNFPPNEEITAYDMETDETACTDPNGPQDDPNTPNALVEIRNLTGIDWTEVWYVADPETTLTNYDGWINGQLAFKIDSVGINTPLVFESIIADNIFQSGEIWRFIIQDYRNSLGGPPSALDSVGVPSGGYPPSTGSIIAIPEPITLVMFILGVIGIVRRK